MIFIIICKINIGLSNVLFIYLESFEVTKKIDAIFLFFCLYLPMMLFGSNMLLSLAMLSLSLLLSSGW